jgi:hypothetical protein
LITIRERKINLGIDHSRRDEDIRKRYRRVRRVNMIEI